MVKKIKKSVQYFMYAIGALLSIILLLAVLMVWVTPVREAVLTLAVNKGLEYSPEPMVITGIESPSLAHIKMASISTPQVLAQSVELKLSFSELLTKTLVVDFLTVESAILHAPPPTKDTLDEASKVPQGIEIPVLPWSVDVQKISIKSLDYAALMPENSPLPVAPHAVDFSVFWPSDQHFPHFKLLTDSDFLQFGIEGFPTDKHILFKGEFLFETGQEKGQSGIPLKSGQTINQLSSEFEFELIDQGVGQDWRLQWQRLNMATTADLTASAGETLINLSSHGELAVSKDFQDIETFDMTLVVNDSEHHLTGGFTQNSLKLNSEINQFDLNIISPWLPDSLLRAGFFGMLEGQLELDGDFNQAPISFAVEGDMSLAGKLRQQRYALLAQFNSDLNTVQANTSFSFLGTELRAQGEYGLKDQALDISAQLDTQFDAENKPTIKALLSDFGQIMPDEWDQYIEPLKMSLRSVGEVRGTVTQPEFEWSLEMAGEYPHRSSNFSVLVSSSGTRDKIKVSEVQVNLGDQSAETLNKNQVNVIADIDLKQKNIEATLDYQLTHWRALDAFYRDELDLILEKSALAPPLIDLIKQLELQSLGEVALSGGLDDLVIIPKLEFQLNFDEVDFEQLPAHLSTQQFNLTLSSEAIRYPNVNLSGLQLTNTLTSSDGMFDPVRVSARGDIDLMDQSAPHFNLNWQMKDVSQQAVTPWLSLFQHLNTPAESSAIEWPDMALLVQHSGRFEGGLIHNNVTAAATVSGAFNQQTFKSDTEISAENVLEDIVFSGQFAANMGEDGALLTVFNQWSGTLTSLNIEQFKVLGGEQNEILLKGDITVSDAYDEGTPFGIEQVDLSAEVFLDVEESLQLATRLGILMPESVSNITGGLHTDLAVRGNMEEPHIEANTQLSVQLMLASLTDVLSVELDQEIRTEKGQITQTGQWSVNDFVELSTRTEFTNHMSMIEASEIELAVKGRADLKKVWELLPETEQKMSGVVDLELSMTGTADAPSINGQATLKNGRMSNGLSGTEMRNINVQMLAKEQNVSLSLSANDSKKGTLKMDGRTVLQGVGFNDLLLTAQLNNMHLIKRPDVDGEVSGDLTVVGSNKRLDVTGLLDITPLSVRLDQIKLSSIPELSIEKNDDEVMVDNSNIHLNIELVADNRAFLNGLGLDAEMTGAAVIQGTSNNPKVSGDFSIDKGQIKLLTKAFKFEQGIVRVEGTSVYLDVRGEHQGDDHLFVVNVTGNESDLNIELSSIPALPEDQIVSQLMFGRGVEEMSAIQSIMLANALNALRKDGDLGGIDAIREATELLTLDNFDIAENKDGLQVTAGKYLNERVYFEVGSSGDGVGGSLQIELTPSLDLETYGDSSDDGEAGIELQWSHDY